MCCINCIVLLFTIIICAKVCTYPGFPQTTGHKFYEIWTLLWFGSVARSTARDRLVPVVMGSIPGSGHFSSLPYECLSFEHIALLQITR